MASVIYLDVDDEITSAAARIRGAESTQVALVLPQGSHLATSRINFRLLARAAQERSRQLVIVAPDAAARALAISAGLEVYGSVRELEDEEAEEAQEAEAAEGGAGAAPDLAASPTSVVETPAKKPRQGASATARPTEPSRPEAKAAALPAPAGAGLRPTERTRRERPAAPDLPVIAAERRRGPRTAAALLIGLVAVLLVVGAVLGYLFLPAATIVVTPRVEPVGPLTLAVRADPAAVAPDPERAVVPATVESLPLEASAQFPSTGTKVTETRARGSVTFSSYDPARSNTIPAGSIVATQSDVQFTTGQAVILPPATLVDDGHGGTKIIPSTGDTPVTAVAKGTGGNVPAGAIKIVPPSENPVVTKVTNPRATTGGTHTETLVVAQKDIDRATATLTKQLSDNLTALLANPGGVLPDITVFPETKSLSTPVPTVDPATLLGKAMPTFTYGLSATGRVTTVDESAVRQVAEVRLREGIGTDHDLVRDSVRITVGKGSIQDASILFPVNASASRLLRLDPAELRSRVRGRSVDDARATLNAFGDVTIETWPDFVSSIPTYDFRVDLTVRSPVAVEDAGASPSAASGGSGPSASPGDAEPSDAEPSAEPSDAVPTGAPGSAAP